MLQDILGQLKAKNRNKRKEHKFVLAHRINRIFSRIMDCFGHDIKTGLPIFPVVTTQPSE